MATQTVINERRALHAYLSEHSHDGWHDFAAKNGVSVSALLEVIGDSLADNANTLRVSVHVDAARVLDAMRRKRRRR